LNEAAGAAAAALVVPLSPKLLDNPAAVLALDQAEGVPISGHAEQLGSGCTDHREGGLDSGFVRSEGCRHQQASLTACAAAQLGNASFLEAGADLRTIQMLLGHAKLADTTVYLHLSRRHLQAVASPLEAINVADTNTAKHSRRRAKR
jgi:integrase